MRTILGILFAAGVALGAGQSVADTVEDAAGGGETIVAMLEGMAEASGPAAAVPALAAGEFVWRGEPTSRGDVLITISLAEQTLQVYRGGTLVGVSTISSGRPGYETPRGVYTILQKKKRHFSNLYDDAPMPYMQRLTWDGIALHAGRLPGHPDSHGCIRLPKEFARTLYGVTGYDTTVIVAEDMASAVAAGERYGLIGDAPPLDVFADTTFGTLTPGAGTADLNRAMLGRLAGTVR